MAEYHTLFSLQINGLNKKERAWLEKELYKNSEKTETAYEEHYLYFDNDLLVFCFWFISPTSLWIFSEDYGKPDIVADFIQKFLNKFRKNETFGFSYALTASKPILDGFGGGAYFISAKKQKWLGTDMWLMEKEIESHEKN